MHWIIQILCTQVHHSGIQWLLQNSANYMICTTMLQYCRLPRDKYDDVFINMIDLQDLVVFGVSHRISYESFDLSNELVYMIVIISSSIYIYRSLSTFLLILIYIGASEYLIIYIYVYLWIRLYLNMYICTCDLKNI